MKKYLVCVALLLACASCRSYKMLEGKSRPVYFTADSSVFSDPDFSEQSIGYEDLQNLTGNFFNDLILKKGETCKAIISQPTFFFKYDPFLIYPGEHVIIKKGSYNDFTFIKKHGSKRRNRELNFFKILEEIKTIHSYKKSNSLNAMLTLENELKNKLPQFERKLDYQFDSLANVCRVSNKFKKLGKAFLKNQNQDYANLYGLYMVNKDTLEKYNLYKKKCKQLISSIYDNAKKPRYNGHFTALNEMANELLPHKVQRIKNESEFEACFDTVDNNFHGFVKDYLLSQLMYAANKNNVEISSDYLSRYEISCADKAYKNIIYQIKFQNDQNKEKSFVLAVDGSATSLENVVEKYKGKIVFLDFWATWCVPCRQEMPFLKILSQQYKEDKIIFLSLSVDKESQRWQKAMLSNNYKINNSYLLINKEKSVFLKNYPIDAIPRFMIIGKEGKIVNSDSPRPSDPKLKELLDIALQ